MKPEIGYDSIVIGSYISDLLDGIEWNMRHTDLKDPYFEQLSRKIHPRNTAPGDCQAWRHRYANRDTGTVRSESG